VIPMLQQSESFEVVFGSLEDVNKALPRKLFDPLVVSFLEKLSESILSNSSARNFGDLITFAYWCRGANLRRIASRYKSDEIRVGRGKTFHIAPSNVPINFAFSLAFSMLAGNPNLIRLPSKQFPQIDLFVDILTNLSTDNSHVEILQEVCLIRYGHQEDLTRLFSTNASCRMIWGGDETVKRIRSIESDPSTIDISFVNRFSFSAIECSELSQLNDSELRKLVERFYTDSYLFDQNACSSPRILVWVGFEISFAESRNRFWALLEEVSGSRYELESVHAIKKLTEICLAAVSTPEIQGLKKDSNFLYRFPVSSLPKRLVSKPLAMGTFAEIEVSSLGEIRNFVNEKFQTMTYFGFNSVQLRELVELEKFKGIDRIVPIGAALDMGLIWDGYDLPLTLSRIVDIR